MSTSLASEVPPQLNQPSLPAERVGPPVQNPPATPPSKDSAAELLGWTRDPTPSNLCRGYYLESPINFPADVPKENIIVDADQAKFIDNKRTVFSNHVTVLQPEQKISTNRAITTIGKNNNSIETIQAYDDVRVQQSGMLTVSKSADINIPNQTGEFHDTVYRLLRSKKASAPISNNNAPHRLLGLTAHGEASVARQTSASFYSLTGASYTTCSPLDNSWNLHAKNVYIDESIKYVKAKNVYFTVAGIPIAYTPYISFSYDNTPKSGLLAPVLGYTEFNGFVFGIPYYWYIAPNLDLTITPTYFSSRGLRAEADFNYLTWNSLGEFYFSLLPGDRAFAHFKQTAPYNFPGNPGLNRLEHASTTRGYYYWQHQTLFNEYWTWLNNIHYVTDDYYFQDFGGGPDQTTLNQLIQKSALQFRGEHWNFQGLLQNFQTLHPVNLPTFSDQYARMPQLNLNTDYPDQWGGFGIGGQFEYVNFTQPLIINYYPTNLPTFPINTPTTGNPVLGQRINIQPYINLPLYKPWGYFTPLLQVNERIYKLSNLNAPSPNDISKTIPIFNIDSGLYFDRDTRFGKSEYTLTFEPRLFYLFVPTVNQSDIPLFDTSEPVFTYDTIFQTNRYIGLDRISNANQIGLGLTSHLINKETGANRLTASIGALFYFADRDVPLSNSSPNDKTKISPIAGLLTYNITDALVLTGNGAWNPNYNFLQNGSFNLGYYPDPRRVLNFGASYQRADIIDPGVIPLNSNNTINQISASASWPLSYSWSAVAALNYNINNNYAQNYLVGLEYNTCCWAMRVVTARNFIYPDQQNRPVYDTSYYVQWVLKGLTNIGTGNPVNLLTTNIPGYTDTIYNY